MKKPSPNYFFNLEIFSICLATKLGSHFYVRDLETFKIIIILSLTVSDEKTVK